MPEFLPNHVKSMIATLEKEFNGNIDENKNSASFAIKGHVLGLINECIIISEPYSPRNSDENNDQKTNVRIKIAGQLENFATKLQQKTDEAIKQLSTEILEIGENNQTELNFQLIKLSQSKLIDLIINITIPESDKLTLEEFNNPLYKKEHDYQQAIKNNLKKLLEIAMNETHKIDGLLGNQFSKIPYDKIQNLSDNILRPLHQSLQTFTKILVLQTSQALLQNRLLKNQPQTNSVDAKNDTSKIILSTSCNHLFFNNPQSQSSSESAKITQTNLTPTNTFKLG